MLVAVEPRRLRLEEEADQTAVSALVSLTMEPARPSPCQGQRMPFVIAMELMQCAWDPCEWLQPPAMRMENSVLRWGTQMKSIKFTQGRRWRRLVAACGREPWPPWTQQRQRQPRPPPGTPAIALAQPMRLIG